MNKSILIGLLGGIGIATAGGVAGYALMSKSDESAQPGSAVVEEVAAVEQVQVEPAAPAASIPAPAPQPAAPRSQAPAPRPAQAAPPPQPAQVAAAPAPAAEPEMRCWDEEVTVQADPRDDRAIAGTAAGAVVGGAIAKNLGDDNDLATAAGAAAGAFAGRRLQRRVQENNTTTVIEQRCEPVQ